MVEQLDLSNEDVGIIAELIDALIMKLVPCWCPSGSTSSIPSGSDRLQNGATSDLLPLVKVVGQETPESFYSGISAELHMTIASDASTNKPLGSFDYSVELNKTDLGSDFVMHVDSISKHDKSIKDSEDNLSELKLELNAIDMQYNQCFKELSRMREEAIENAKKKWITKKEYTRHVMC